jgi:PAS domain S-box-containing protein
MTTPLAPILFIDDDSVTRHILHDYLSRAGYSAVATSSAEEAIEKLKSFVPSLILLDLILPGIDGYQLLQRFRSDPALQDVPIVVLTALEGDKEVEQAFEFGADDFLHKPFRQSELIARIASQLRIQSYVEELAKKERDAAVLVELTHSLASALDLRDVLHNAVKRIAETVSVDRCSIIVVREGNTRGFVIAASDNPSVQNLAIELDKYPELQTVLLTRRALTIEDSATHPLFDTVRDRSRFNSLTLLPIAFEERALGVLFLRSHENRGRLSERELAFCRIASNAMAVALRNARVMQELREETVALDSRAEAAEKLVKSLERYHGLFRSAAEGIVVFDSTGIVRFVNPHGADIFGEPPEIIVGRSLFSRILPEELGRVREAVVATRDGERRAFDLLLQRTNGTKVTIAISLSALDDDDEAIVGTFRDVSLDRANAIDLRRTRDFLTALVESTPDAIVAADRRGQILVWNRAAERICKLSRNEVVGELNISSLYPPGVAQEIMRRLREAENGQDSVRIENFRTELTTPSGETIPIHLSAAIVRDGENEAGTVGIFSDLRDRLNMEQRLAQAQEQLKLSEKQALVAQLAGTAAHELNQPLTSIMGHAELMKRRLAVDSPAIKSASVIIQEAERMADIVRKLGTMSRLDTKPYIGDTEIFDLDKASSITDGRSRGDS